jgi:cellulose synthase operon protein C
VAITQRVSALFALRYVDGPEPLRSVRDDARLPPAVRAEAAANLITFTTDDRLAALRLLGVVASDRQARPARRFRALGTLAKIGTPGRARAIEVLGQMLTDHDLSLRTRVQTACRLADLCPHRRGEFVHVLYQLQAAAAGLVRIEALAALGKFDPAQATWLLRALLEDRTLTPIVRLRVANSLATLRRDQREYAALVAREVMNNTAAPRHVRRRAACYLARWSLLCRQEARSMIAHLDGAAALAPLTVHASPA